MNPLLETLAKLHPQQPAVPATVNVAPTGKLVGRPVTQKQLDYIKSLLEKKVLSDAQLAAFNQQLPLLNSMSASSMIGFLVAQPWKPRASSAPQAYNGPKIKEGRYAVTDPQDNLLKFYVVDAPTEGKWAGGVFLNQLASDNRMPVKNFQERSRIFSLISKDMLGALKRYGQEVGRCGHCNRLLTDAESRERGIGPVCAGIV